MLCDTITADFGAVLHLSLYVTIYKLVSAVLPIIVLCTVVADIRSAPH